MPKIEIKEKTLSSRGPQVQGLLRPISRVEGGPAWRRVTSGRDVVIAAHDGSPPKDRYTDWRFATKHRDFRAHYFERWVSSKKGHFHLEQAYLHFFRTVNTFEEQKYLLLHCDPNEADSAAHVMYKRGPHLHISTAEQPIPHSHIALCLINLDSVLDSIESLTSAFHHCIVMIQDEFLSRL